MTQPDELAITEPAHGSMGLCLNTDRVTFFAVVVVAAVALVALVLAAVSLSQGPAQVTINGRTVGSGVASYNNGVSYMANAVPNNKIWTFAIGHDFSPYEYQNSQGYTDGFNVELISAVCQEAGVTCHLVYDDYNNCWNGNPGKHPIPGPGLFGGWYDACTGWAQQATRLNSVRFSNSWTRPGRSQFIVRSGNTNSIKQGFQFDLTGRKIGFLDGWVSDEHCVARQGRIQGNVLTSNQIFHYKTQADAYEALKSGAIDALFHSTTANLDKGLESAGRFGSCMEAGLSMMIKKDSYLASWFNPALESIKEKGIYLRICKEAQTKHAVNDVKIRCFYPEEDPGDL